MRTVPVLNILTILQDEASVKLAKIFSSKQTTFHCHSCPDLDTGLLYLSKNSVDAVILNPFLTGLQHFDVLRMIESQFPQVSILCLLEPADSQLAPEAIRNGAEDCLIWNQFDEHRLATMIHYAKERKLRKKEILEAAHHYNLAVIGSTHGLWDLKLFQEPWHKYDANELWCSDRFLELLGFTRNEPPKGLKTWFDRIHPSDKFMIVQALNAHLEEKKPFDVQCRILLKNGPVRWFRIRGEAFRGPDGRALRMAGSLVDIQVRKQAEEELLIAEEKYRSVFENSAVAITVTDEHERIISWNNFTEKMLGMTAEDLHMRPVKSLYPKEEWAKIQSMELRKKGMLHHLETKMLRKNGAVFDIDISVTVLKTSDGGKTGSIGVIRDITERILAEETLRKAKEDAVAANRAKSEFLANMSHEIRTPLNGIIGMTDLILETELSAEQKEYADTVKKSADALLTLINDILDFSKVEAGKLTIEPYAFDLRSSVEDVVDLLAPTAQEKNIDLVARYIPGTPCRLIGDAGRIRQILTNLLSNAIKFTAKGHVLVSVECLKNENEKSLIRFSIEDSGIGIPKEHLNRIFEKFTQADASTSRRFGGTGLGLAICSELVNLMKGKIGVKSEMGKGSTFWFDILLDVDRSKTEPLPKADLKDVKIAICESNSVNQKVFQELLASWSMNCITFLSGKELLQGLRKASQGGAPFQMAILDYQVSDCDVEELGKTIKADPSLANVSLILTTTTALRGDAKKFAEAGFSAYLVKPIRPSQLMDILAIVWAVAFYGLPRKLITRHSLRENLVVQMEKAHGNDPRNRQDSKVYEAKQGRVLLAEDNLVNQQVAKRMLEKLGCDVDVAINGIEALQKIEKKRYDLVFMDCMMPELDGFSAAKMIRQLKTPAARIPIIAITANAMSGDREKCLEAGMNDYVKKPVVRRDLDLILQKWIKGEKNIGHKEGIPNIQKQPAKPIALAEKTEDSGTVVINVERLISLKEFADDKDGSFIIGLFQTYLSTAPQRVESMKRALNEKNPVCLSREAHGLKGSSSNLGIEKVALLCKEIEIIGKANTVEGADGLIHQLVKEIHCVEAQYMTVIKKAA